MLKYKYTIKNLIILALTAAVAVMNFLTLLFTVVHGGSDYLSGSEKYSANGITLAFTSYPVIVEDCGKWLSVYSLFHFIASLAIIFLLVVFWCVTRKPFGRLGTFSLIASELMALVYLINGCVAYSTASEYAGLYFECYTFAFLPFIIITGLVGALIAVKLKMPDDFRLSENR